MKAYHNSAVLQFDDSTTGNAGAGVPVTVRLSSTQALVSIFDLDEVAIANPTTTDSKGNYAFKTADGVYDIIISEGTGDEVKLEKVQISEFIGVINDLSQAYEFATVAEYKAFSTAFPVGKVIHLKDRKASFLVISGTGTATGNGIIASDQVTQSIEISRGVTDEINANTYGGVIDFGVTDNTAVIQECIDTLSLSPESIDSGGLILIPVGMSFNLKDLLFKKKQNLRYFLDDDLSTTISSTLSTNELVTFAANANNNGIVNEERFTAPFHPGIGVDVRKDVLGQASYLGPGQTMNNPARASFNIYDEQINVYKNLYISYPEYSLFTGVGWTGTLNRVLLSGISTASFTVNPVFGDLVTGITSLATGYVHTIDGTELVVTWISGEYITGENVVNNRGTIAAPINETSSTTITTPTHQILTGSQMGCSKEFGEFTLCLPFGSASGVFSIGGRSTVTATRAAGQEVSEVITDPVRSWVSNLEAVTPEGKDIAFDTTGATDRKRLVVRDYKTTVDKGMVGAVSAFTSVNSYLATGVSNFNVSTITNPSTGNYTVTFTDALSRADYVPQLTLQNGTGAMLDIQVEVYFITVGSVGFRVYTRSTGALVNLPASSAVMVTCFGGDI